MFAIFVVLFLILITDSVLGLFWVVLIGANCGIRRCVCEVGSAVSIMQPGNEDGNNDGGGGGNDSGMSVFSNISLEQMIVFVCVRSFKSD